MSDSNVINLAGEPVTALRLKDAFCQSGCTRVLVDLHKRQLTCRECSAVIDAFDWAKRIACEESDLMRRIEALKLLRLEHGIRVEELKTEEQRIKGRIRSAKDSLLRSAGV